MNAWQIKALAEWLKMLEGSAKGGLQSQYGHLIPKETDTGRPSTMELAQRARREKALANRPAATTGTLQGELEAVEIPTVPGKELAVIPRAEKQARVYEYKNVPNIQVDPSGEAKIISDLSASIRRYREMKTGMEPSFREVGGGRIAGSRWEPERSLSQVEQSVPEKEIGGFIPEPGYVQGSEMQKRFSGGQISTPHTKDTLTAQRIEGQTAYDKRMARLRAAQAGKTSKFDELVRRYRRAAGKRIRELKRKGHSRSGRMGGGYLPADLAGNLKDSTMKSMILGHRRKPWN